MKENFKKILTTPFAFFAYFVIVAAILFALFGWGSPMSKDNLVLYDLLTNDSTAVVVNKVSEVDLLRDTVTDKNITVQGVWYNKTTHQASKDTFVLVEVKKGFLKYKPVRVL